MELTYDEVEKAISRISLGEDYTHIKSRDEIIVIKQPDSRTKMLADAIYEESYHKALKDGLLPTKELEKIIKERGFFTEEDENQVSKLRMQLAGQNTILSKTVKVKANRTRLKNNISELENKIDIVLHKKHSKLMLSAESKSTEAKNQYLCWACTHTLSGGLLWPTHKSYKEETDLQQKTEILSKFIEFLSGLDVAIIRFVARSNLWRIRYTTSMKTSEQLFGRPVTQYTNDQLSLAYWSSFYDQVYSMMPNERPAEEVIHDDKSLDAYMDEYYKELSNDSTIQRAGNHARGSMSAFEKEEVIVTKSNELYQDIEYDKPREAQQVKDRSDLRKKASGKKRK